MVYELELDELLLLRELEDPEEELEEEDEELLLERDLELDELELLLDLLDLMMDCCSVLVLLDLLRSDLTAGTAGGV